ncbi:MAG: hypothetical protein JSW00_16365 [Thermoplasmata archaeon]|nr:MAG: hypothetical protein JSW00_16365 [Thermoplasmata archaeon]
MEKESRLRFIYIILAIPMFSFGVRFIIFWGILLPLDLTERVLYTSLGIILVLASLYCFNKVIWFE